MSFLSKLVAAPFRILDIPNKIVKAIVEDDEPTLLDNVAEGVEDQVNKITGD